MRGSENPSRYNSVAIVLHWAMALFFVGMLASGFAMANLEALPQSLKFNMYQWHKSLGVLLLLAAFLRIAVKFLSKTPPLPASFPRIEKIAAKAGHWALYGFMFAMPLTGWVMVSASVYGLPTIVFDMFEWPHIPNIQGNETLEKLAKNAHFILGILFAVTIAGHIAATIKHYIKDKENLLKRMWWS